MLIHENMKLAEVVLHDHTLVPVINRFGIHLGFGDDNLADICNRHGVNTGFFVTILNAFHDPNYFPEERLRMFPAALLIDYLRKAHHYFLEDKLPEIAGLIDRMAAESPLDTSTSGLISGFFAGYSGELKKHILREEKKVYPYVLELETAVLENRYDAGLHRKISEYPIADYEAEHENVEEKLMDLKNILIKYLPEPQNDKPGFLVLRELFTLEKELNEHARIEDIILIPKVKELEDKLKKLKPA
jgi:regulator of cell morphogenesis and NO signaling